MEGDPFSLVEAMTIAGFATGCEQGYIYLRGEYPLARARLERRDRRRRARAASSATTCSARGFAFDIELRTGAGAYICGEETALFNSIEGYRGEPRNKPPFPVEVGLFGQPTVVNNVETLVNVLPIVLDGGRAFAAIGTAASTGHEAVLRVGRCRAARASTRCRSAPRCAKLIDLAGGVAGGRRCRRCCSAARPGRFVTPEELDTAADLRGRAGGGSDARLGRRRSRSTTRVDLMRAADAHRGVLPRRELRPVRALPRRHRPPGGGAARDCSRVAAADRSSDELALLARARTGDARRVDLRARPDRVERDRVRARPARRVQRGASHDRCRSAASVRSRASCR